MNLLGTGLAGALQGMGSGLAQQANAKKTTALEMLRQNTRRQRLADDRALRSFGRGTGQAFQNDQLDLGSDLGRGSEALKSASRMPRHVQMDATAFPAGAYPEDAISQNRVTGESVPHHDSQARDIIREFNEVEQNYRRIRSSVEAPSQAGDVSAVFSFMKMLDPRSFVREGEIASSENASGVPRRIQSLYNSLLSGDRLPPEMRSGFAGHAGGLYSVAFEQARRFNDQQGERANQYGSVRDGSARPDQAFKPVEAEAAAPDVIEDGYRFLGGDASDPSSWEKVDQ